MQLHIPAVGILRGVESVFFGELMEASFSSSLQDIDITMNMVKIFPCQALGIQHIFGTFPGRLNR